MKFPSTEKFKHHKQGLYMISKQSGLHQPSLSAREDLRIQRDH